MDGGGGRGGRVGGGALAPAPAILATLARDWTKSPNRLRPANRRRRVAGSGQCCLASQPLAFEFFNLSDVNELFYGCCFFFKKKKFRVNFDQWRFLFFLLQSFLYCLFCLFCVLLCVFAQLLLSESCRHFLLREDSVLICFSFFVVDFFFLPQ